MRSSILLQILKGAEQWTQETTPCQRNSLPCTVCIKMRYTRWREFPQKFQQSSLPRLLSTKQSIWWGSEMKSSNMAISEYTQWCCIHTQNLRVSYTLTWNKVCRWLVSLLPSNECIGVGSPMPLRNSNKIESHIYMSYVGTPDSFQPLFYTQNIVYT